MDSAKVTQRQSRYAGSKQSCSRHDCAEELHLDLLDAGLVSCVRKSGGTDFNKISYDRKASKSTKMRACERSLDEECAQEYSLGWFGDAVTNNQEI